MSYQIIDDILDFTSSAKELGKPAGNDLLQGNITLPVLYAMRDQSFYKLLREIFANPSTVGDQEMQQIISELKKTQAIKQAYETSDLYLQKALKSLDSLPASKAKQTLQDIAKYIGKRRS